MLYLFRTSAGSQCGELALIIRMKLLGTVVARSICDRGLDESRGCMISVASAAVAIIVNMQLLFSNPRQTYNVF